MSQTLVQNYIHLVFSTKKRQEIIDKVIRPDLFAYLAGVCINQNCPAIIVGSHTNHVHILFNLSKNISLKQLVGKLKTASSKWMKLQGAKYKEFFWQNGYGAFSVSKNELGKVKEYILNQNSHHKKHSFKDEYVRLLEQYDVDYNLDYLFKD
jgi:putative transposase